MTPYQGLLFFYCMAALLMPAVVLGLWEKRLWGYGLAFTAAMLCIVFGQNGQWAALVVFALWQTGICFVFLRMKRRGRARTRLMVALALLPLLAVKAGAVVAALSALQLLGVSYMTFRAVQVLLDIADGKVTAVSIAKYWYFLLFFPSVASGPVDRYRRFLGDLDRRLSRGEYLRLLGRGLWKLLWGAVSCIVISALIMRLWLAKLPDSGAGATLSYLYGYTLYLYFNFAGYSQMAVGTAHILGVALPGNFNMPFLSVDMKDFWARWHISLSSWMRDYVYTRFVLRSIKRKRFKNQRTASYLGYLLTMAAMGAWHGLTPAYLCYGAYHGLLMCGNEALDLHCKPFKRWKRQWQGQAVLILVTFHLYGFGLLIFSGRLF